MVHVMVSDVSPLDEHEPSVSHSSMVRKEADNWFSSLAFRGWGCQIPCRRAVALPQQRSPNSLLDQEIRFFELFPSLLMPHGLKQL